MLTSLHIDRTGYFDKHKEKLQPAVQWLQVIFILHCVIYCKYVLKEFIRVRLVEQTPNNLWSLPLCSNQSALVSEFFILKKSPIETNIAYELYAAHAHRKIQTFRRLSPSRFCHPNSQFSPVGYFHKGKLFGVTNSPCCVHRTQFFAPSCMPPSLSQPSRLEGRRGQIRSWCSCQ